MYSCETSFILVSIVIEQQLQLAGIYHLLLSNITTAVDTCLLAKFEGGLNVLHEADDDAVIYGWNLNDCSTHNIISVLPALQYVQL